MEAINFALTHDDGQNSWNLNAADMVLTGPSRTSKSPTCIYLANKGFRAANVPLVTGCAPPEELFTLSRPLVIGLTIDPKRLMEIRKSRLATMGDHDTQNYIDIDVINEEIVSSKRLFAKYRWPIIDVTRKSIEETSAHIIQLYHKKYGTKHG
jgi:hypothetical protein